MSASRIVYAKAVIPGMRLYTALDEMKRVTRVQSSLDGCSDPLDKKIRLEIDYYEIDIFFDDGSSEHCDPLNTFVARD